AQRIASILPELSREESLETTRIYSAVGRLKEGESLVLLRPFRSPHHTISEPGLVGGGSTPAPGEISLAHNGVLFLDELPEFNRRTLEVLRQPLEDNNVTISRAIGSTTFPANLMLVAAMNPCPCGYRSDPKRECTCTPPMIKKYVSKISGPLLDRIDIHIQVPSVEYKELSSEAVGEPSNKIRQRVEQARQVQLNRFKNSRIFFNAGMSTKQLKQYCRLDDASKQIMALAIDKMGLSARAHDRILKVSRTIADLDGMESLSAEHVAESIQYRSLDREGRF
ncbi:MAG: ATP-binding protein, partial [Nitrospinae bacterium]|nr:ATP-binding protein [Nitrospinota bacterium]